MIVVVATTLIGIVIVMGQKMLAFMSVVKFSAYGSRRRRRRFGRIQHDPIPSPTGKAGESFLSLAFGGFFGAIVISNTEDADKANHKTKDNGGLCTYMLGIGEVVEVVVIGVNKIRHASRVNNVGAQQSEIRF